ncbi:MAG: carboxypeptidase regulatory-like domain-containing protein [Deltaproteobacteria bacterium]|nr:carboxypeptidase regulatory-like domain-containing protein [Deltaproteobacteria bacterium]
MNKRLTVIICMTLLLCHAMILSAIAGTTFVSGVRDGINTYAIINHNGTEYRTDEMGSRVNQLLWNNLSEADRRSLINTYSFKIGTRINHFGSEVSGEMADWINDQQGWTDAAEALKQRHMNKTYPELAAAFGPGANLDLPDFYSSNPEIVNSDDYKEASRLVLEIQTDFEVGREVYTMLENAKWDQISIAVKTISEPLIKIIVDNFITGFVTNGASRVSELLVTARGFVNDLKDFIMNQRKISSPPTPIDLINRLEQFLEDMENTAITAISVINTKKSQLQTIADRIHAADAQLRDEYEAAAAAKRAEFSGITSNIPAPAVLEEFTGTDDQKRSQAMDYYYTLTYERTSVSNAKNSEISEVNTKYSAHLNRTPVTNTEPFRYMAGASDGFSSPYFEIYNPLTDIAEYEETQLPSAVSSIERSRDALADAEYDVNDTIEIVMPSINDLHSKALWLDQYSELLGYQPSSSMNFPGLRNFDTLIDVVATTERTVDNILDQMTAEDELVSLLLDNFETGVDKRIDWINSEWQRYDSLRFNAENSLSYVIAALRQLDRLHSDPWFKIYPGGSCYEEDCFYRYTVNVDAINAEISALSTSAQKEEARSLAVAKLLKLRTLEETLIDRLEIAQNAHLNDVQALNNFFSALYSRYPYLYSMEDILEEFRSVTGKTMKNMYDIWNDLAPNITYYYLGDGNWIRAAQNERALFFLSAVEKISGKIPEYYEMLDLYNDMKINKSYYMGLSETEFNDFMAYVTSKIGQAPDGTYITAFKVNNVWGPEFPCWQLLYKVMDRRNRLNNEYRYGTISDPDTWEVSGSVTGPDGQPVSGAQVLLTGYLNLSTTTRSDGTFVFDFISNGEYSLKVYSDGYEIPAPTASVNVNNANSSPASFTAIPIEDPGYVISGRLVYENGNPVAGAQVVLTSDTGTQRTAMTGPTGGYLFSGVEMGEHSVKPVASGIDYYPPFRIAAVPTSIEDADFLIDYDQGGTLNSDTDGDGMPDEWEADNGLNPLVNDANEDADGDRFKNLTEYKRGTDPQDENSYPPRAAMPWIPLLLSEY